ncbi:MAG: hypothetical protein Q9P01_18955 [Anaerolineae bacterium]|nr:hypothetical protein [Anaerolineae bacterium]MDQ7036831.1 hypothetical protein [Anaerolineae bacterium]
MSQFSDDIQSHIAEIDSKRLAPMMTAVQALLTMNTPDSQAALLMALHQLYSAPDLYWQVIDNLGEQGVIEAVEYYEKVLVQDNETFNYRLKEVALHHIHHLGAKTARRIISESLLYLDDEDLLRLALSLLAEPADDAALYRLLSIVRQHSKHFVRRAAVKQMAYRFDSQLLIPFALGLIHSDFPDTGERGSAVSLLWHLIMQHKLAGYENEVILALKYCLYCLPELGIMPYRCLMSLPSPLAKTILSEWDTDSKLKPDTVQIFP